MSIASESGARCCDDAVKSGVVTGREQFSFSRLLKEIVPVILSK